MGCQYPSVRVEETLMGRRGIVDLWHYAYESISDADLLARQKALLTPEEQDRQRRFHFERDRRQFLATRALVRTVLSNYAPVAPADWRFAEGSHGKPYIVQPETRTRLFFNLANTPGLVVCAVSVAHEMVGVDVERADRQVEIFELADRFFSPSEAAALRTWPVSEQNRGFFTFWTLKESYIKARGLGLALPLEKFSFHLDAAAIGVSLDATLADDPARWQFALWPQPPYMMAVGVDTGGAPLSLRVQEIIPLRFVG